MGDLEVIGKTIPALALISDHCTATDDSDCQHIVIADKIDINLIDNDDYDVDDDDDDDASRSNVDKDGINLVKDDPVDRILIMGGREEVTDSIDEDTAVVSNAIEDIKDIISNRNDDGAPTLIDNDRNEPALVDNDNNAPALVYNDNNAPALVYNDNNAPALVDNDNNAPALVDNDNNAPALVDNDNNAPALVDNDNNAPALVDNDNNAQALVDNDNNAPALVDNDNNAPALVDSDSSSSTLTVDVVKKDRYGFMITDRFHLSTDINEPSVVEERKQKEVQRVKKWIYMKSKWESHCWYMDRERDSRTSSSSTSSSSSSSSSSATETVAVSSDAVAVSSDAVIKSSSNTDGTAVVKVAKSSKLKSRIRKGIPDVFRGTADVIHAVTYRI